MSPHDDSAPACQHAADAVAHARCELTAGQARRMRAHLEVCDSCRSLVAETVALAALAETAASAMQPSPAFERRLMARLEATPGRLLLPRAAALLLAGAALVAAAAALWRRGGIEEPRVVAAQPVAAAVDWLLKAQGPDGTWDPGAWGGNSRYRIGVSALIVLALGERGPGPGVDAARSRALEHLVQAQRPDGLIGAEDVAGIYNHSLATLALLQGVPALAPERDAALERALGFLLRRQTAAGGWGYLNDTGGEPSPAASFWPLEALLAARRRQPERYAQAAARGLGYLAAGNAEPGARASSPGLAPHACGQASAAALAALTSHYASSSARAEDGPGRKAALRARDDLLRGLSRHGAADPYESYWAVRALREAPPGPERAMLERIERQVLEAQVEHGAMAGSWEPRTWSVAGGRVATTALAALALQTGNRRIQ